MPTSRWSSKTDGPVEGTGRIALDPPPNLSREAKDQFDTAVECVSLLARFIGPPGVDVEAEIEGDADLRGGEYVTIQVRVGPLPKAAKEKASAAKK